MSDTDQALDDIFGEQAAMMPEAQEPQEPQEEQNEGIESEYQEEQSNDQEQEQEAPPGFLTYEEWIEKGFDPEEYKGPKAYTKEYERIKRNEKELNELKSMMKQVVKSSSEWKQKQEEQMQAQIRQAKADAERRLAEAKENLDIDGALEAQREVDQYANQGNQQPQQQQPNPVVADYFAKNPIADQNSDQFDPDYYRDLSRYYNGVLRDIEGQGGQITDQVVSMALEEATRAAKSIHSAKFVNPRNARRGAPPAGAITKAPKPAKAGDRLRKTSIKRQNNAQDTNAASDMYELIKSMGGEDFAEDFAKKVLS